MVVGDTKLWEDKCAHVAGGTVALWESGFPGGFETSNSLRNYMTTTCQRKQNQVRPTKKCPNILHHLCTFITTRFVMSHIMFFLKLHDVLWKLTFLVFGPKYDNKQQKKKQQPTNQPTNQPANQPTHNNHSNHINHNNHNNHNQHIQKKARTLSARSPPTVHGFAPSQWHGPLQAPAICLHFASFGANNNNLNRSAMF